MMSTQAKHRAQILTSTGAGAVSDMRTAGRRGLSRLLGFAAGMVVLAAVSLVMIPALIRAGGDRAWGAIAVGQSIGAVAAVIIYFGWGVSGPAAIAQVGGPERWREVRESLVARLAVSAPALVAACAVSAWLGKDDRFLAGVSAFTAGSLGLGLTWYFVGTASPWTMFFTATIPRVVGSVAGIGWMWAGGSALAGLLGQLAGVALGLLIPILVIQRSTRSASPVLPRRPIRSVLSTQRNGVATSATAAAYSAAPILIVSLLAPSVLPAFAVLDKIQKQIYTALTPVTAVLQGWVARAAKVDLGKRIKHANMAMAVFALGCGLLTATAGRLLATWLGAGHVAVDIWALALTAVWLSLNLQESSVSTVSLVPLGRIAYMARVTGFGSLIGLVAVAGLTLVAGVDGALLGVSIGLLIRILLCLAGIRRHDRTGKTGVSAQTELEV